MNENSNIKASINMNELDISSNKSEKKENIYNVIFDFELSLNHVYHIHNELFNQRIPIIVDGVRGYVIFPGIKDETISKSTFIPIMYALNGLRVGYIANQYGDFDLKKCLCQFYSDHELGISFLHSQPL